MVRSASKQETDQFLFRMPSDLRERLAQRAAANGRSMAAEVVEAIEKHLEGADRVATMWEIFTKHREDIETIPWMLLAITDLEDALHDVAGGEETPVGVHTRPLRKRYAAYVASMPTVTVKQAQTIRARLKETGGREASFLREMGVSRIEDIRDFERAMAILDDRRVLQAWKE